MHGLAGPKVGDRPTFRASAENVNELQSKLPRTSMILYPMNKLKQYRTSQISFIYVDHRWLDPSYDMHPSTQHA
jgi:hypothetical protein